MLRRLEVEADEMASFVQKKANKQWMWIAMEATTRQVIAFHVGDRSRRSAKRLWAKIPGNRSGGTGYATAGSASWIAVQQGRSEGAGVCVSAA